MQHLLYTAAIFLVAIVILSLLSKRTSAPIRTWVAAKSKAAWDGFIGLMGIEK